MILFSVTLYNFKGHHALQITLNLQVCHLFISPLASLCPTPLLCISSIVLELNRKLLGHESSGSLRQPLAKLEVDEHNFDVKCYHKRPRDDKQVADGCAVLYEQHRVLILFF